jgi:hypothetical protein
VPTPALKTEPPGFAGLPDPYKRIDEVERQVAALKAQGADLNDRVITKPAPRARGLATCLARLSAPPYRSGRSTEWLRIKNPNSPAMVRHREDRW